MGWKRLARWSASSFMFGGALVLVALLLILVYQAGIERVFFAIAALFLVGVAAIVLGMFVLVPLLSASAPKLTRAGAGVVGVFSALTVLALMLIAVLSLLRAVWAGLPEPPAFGVATPPLFGAIVLGHLIFGIASWRTGVPSRRFGILLVAVAALWVLGFVVGLREATVDVWDFLPLAGAAVGTIVAGYWLHDGRSAAAAESVR
jgi:hypothetical protein